MSMQLCVLASGSSGNCSVIKTNAGAFLVDCGIGPRIARSRLADAGLTVSQLAAVCLTHLDRDHFNSLWTPTLAEHHIRIFCPADRVLELLSFRGNGRLEPLVTPFNAAPFEPLPGVSARGFAMAHDDTGSHAFHFSHEKNSIGYATDLGAVPESLIERFCGVDILAIESNYDPQMQLDSGRPRFLQNRIMGGHGHLSNQQAMAAVKAIFCRCRQHGHQVPRHVVVLHRSRQCNCPDRIRDLFLKYPPLAQRLVLSEQDQRTDWLGDTQQQSPWFGKQLTLFADADHHILS